MACFASDGISIEVYKRLRAQGVSSSIARQRASDVCEADSQTRLMAYTAQRQRGLSSEAARRSVAHTSARQSLDLAAPNFAIEKARLHEAACRARGVSDCAGAAPGAAAQEGGGGRDGDEDGDGDSDGAGDADGGGDGDGAGNPKKSSWFSLDALLAAVRESRVARHCACRTTISQLIPS